MKILIIPARGGSKGIIKKNLQTVNGISLIERALSSALKSDVDKIIVSTDDLEIEKIATKYAVEVHKRSEQASSDTASTEEVILEVMSKFEHEWGNDAILGFCQVTSPFIEVETINKCFEEAQKGFSSFSAREFHGFIWANENNWVPIGHPINFRPRRQDLSQRVMETGAIYCFPLKEFKRIQYRICSDPKPILVDELRTIEIDTHNELKITNLLATQFEISEFNNLPISDLPKVIFTDFDGCLTNDTVKINSFGREKVVVNRKDGLAVKRLRKLGIEVVIVSAETNNVVMHRAKKMKVEALRGVEDKVNTLSQYLDKRAISWSEVWYLGNDVNDLGAMGKAQISFCPLDASPEVFSQAKVVLSRRGGEGLLAEIASRLEKI